MPRKPKQTTTVEPKKKKNLLNTLVKTVNQKEEHIILQLPLTPNQIERIVNIDKKKDFNYEPIPYERNSCYVDDEHNKVYSDETSELCEKSEREYHNLCCFWCCHNVEYKMYGMPVRFDNTTNTYLVYGTFCSLQCANAYNFSVHNGSDKVWEINSLIQMMAKRYGFSEFVRPAPSRYLLKMFNGNLSIEEFRKVHSNNEATYVLNVPPMISLPSSYEIVNTSYVKKNSESS